MAIWHNLNIWNWLDNTTTWQPGMDAPPRGEGGSPAPPRPVKMIKTAGKLRGKIRAWISAFSNRGNQWRNNITTLNNAQSSLSIGYARESKKWKYLLIFLLTGHQLCSWTFVNLWNSSSMSQISFLVLLMMMAMMLVMMLMIMMVMLILITIKVMNVE